MDVIAIARELGKAIQQDENYLRMMTAQQQNDEDAALQQLIGEFNLKRIALNNEINKADKDQEAINKVNDEIKEIYGKIMTNENMLAYNEAKAGLDSMVDFVLQILRGSVNGQDPDLIEQQASCGGSCDSCSGCH
ncbi:MULTISPECIES: YlbF family regulator [Anaerotruncus]|jgi:cell fate (sporulation/competence/biofilm development) regulator YlbF (YheA/YmcA/DUF963 family)|uniref:YlbF family regulator n=1 Tax=Anaerotruncus TaxID=244127 RepID=UPI000833C14E|nr:MULTISPECIES: YlbF family regulator [Anaerotruncus]RGX56479.1 YlbF family regulator [Anaerotruncus sp. AF02-27]